MRPRVLILRAAGLNRDEDAAHAVTLAGGEAVRAHVNRLVDRTLRLADFAMLIIPGGFSYGDHLGAGRLLAIDLQHRLADQLHPFVASGRAVIGICNGFQALVKAGLLPGDARATLTDNTSERFECRWVSVTPQPQTVCPFVRALDHSIETPVAHGEGRFVLADPAALAALDASGQVALRYAADTYPANPNGSVAAIAGVCNAQGNVLGLMPHLENAVLPHQHPRWTREPARAEGEGLALFRHAVVYAAR